MNRKTKPKTWSETGYMAFSRKHGYSLSPLWESPRNAAATAMAIFQRKRSEIVVRRVRITLAAKGGGK